MRKEKNLKQQPTKSAGNPYHRIAVSMKKQFVDAGAEQILSSIKEYLKYDVSNIKIKKVYTINKVLTSEETEAIASGLFADPIIEEGSTEDALDPEYDWTIEVSYKPGVTDNVGRTAQLTIEDYLGGAFDREENVRSSTQYLFRGNMTLDEVRAVAEELLANRLIEDIVIHKNDGSLERAKAFPAEIINVDVSDESLMAISKERQLALSLKEMIAIRDFYAQPDVAAARKKLGLPAAPTDVELEALAQTWSEHCKHKIFNAKIYYTEESKTECIDSIFKTYIKAATDALTAKKPWLVSVFSDNAGIISLNDEYNIAFKVETHNSPSALDPYGGALTGILGVNRDIMGAGNGARIVANTDIFCFASPEYPYPIPKRLLHPKRIFEGVRRGVEHGGNKSGVPTVNGAIVFDDRYLGKPLVYCGTVGIMPKVVGGKSTHVKEIEPGDVVIIAGGRTGRDGIHGATFSSEELHEASPSSAVQIGDPFTQKKLHDFILEARDAGLFRTLTDNGAGGFSSSIGELAELSGGCEIHLDKALLKSLSLKPWEILLSESQERMTLAVPPESVKALEELAALHEVEICAVGTFTDSGMFHSLYQGATVAFLPLEFLHNGVPQMVLEAEWDGCDDITVSLPEVDDYNDELKQLLSCYNICSKEQVIRQYDHEVQGGSALKPLVGVENDGPGDAAVIRPIECMKDPMTHKEGIVVGNGICPRFSDIDAYHMAASALDEAVRNCVAVGADPDMLAILDNFCWPDPVYDPLKTPDGRHKLAQLVRANRALYDYATAFGTPIISGKDSMKNDYKIGETKISVPPTLLISAIGKISDVEKTVSMDVKAAGDLLFVVGLTRNELGCSEYASMRKIHGGVVPKVNAKQAIETYRALHKAIREGLVSACHDCSDGGLGVAFAEMAFAGGLGLLINLSRVPSDEELSTSELLFSESNSRFVVTVDPALEGRFRAAMEGVPMEKVGEVRDDTLLTIRGLYGDPIIREDVSHFKEAWQKPLRSGGAL